MAERTLMKDGLSSVAVHRIAAALTLAAVTFDSDGFVREALSGIDNLELKERVAHLINVLHSHLPENFDECAAVLGKLPEVWLGGEAGDPLSGFAAWPLIDYVAVYGLDYPHISLPLLAKLTRLFSAEFAVRPFITMHQRISFTYLLEWAQSEDEHVRRLVSEGARPRLPWGMQLKQFIDNPAPVLPLLHKLRNDKSQYVRRSVANNMNDIGKDHPKLLIELCQAWRKMDKGKTDWIISHATRSLVKKGFPDVFALLGYTTKLQLEVGEIELKSVKIKMGSDLNFNLVISSLLPTDKNSNTYQQKFVVDYAIYFMRSNGSKGKKVFKLKNCMLGAAEQLEIRKKHAFRKISTRNYYPGEHYLAIHINGVEVKSAPFYLN
ncbi:MAG: 3-methyladenine DNA glycosylase AlkC [Lentisphaeria bacterium]|jgi:3-methyladenine DNA glycosylase AlkC